MRAAGLLAQLYVQRGAFDRAAAVHEALALRRSGAGHGEEATLQQRVDSLRDAVLQVPCRWGPSHFQPRDQTLVYYANSTTAPLPSHCVMNQACVCVPAVSCCAAAASGSCNHGTVGYQVCASLCLSS